MRTTLLTFLLVAQTLLPATAQKLSFGQLCQLIISNPGAVPKSQVYVVPKAPESKPSFSGDVTTCVIYQMAAHNMHDQNWDYSKQAMEWYNQQGRFRRTEIAADLTKETSQYPDLKALVELHYVEIKKSIFTGPQIALSQGPTF